MAFVEIEYIEYTLPIHFAIMHQVMLNRLLKEPLHTRSTHDRKTQIVLFNKNYK